MKFVILFWGEKLELDREVSDKFLVFNYSEIVRMGRESRKFLFDFYDVSKVGNI